MCYIQSYIINDVESHQLVLPKEYQQAILCMLYDDYGHQGLDHTLALVRERFYQSTMYEDITEYVTNCHQCHVTKGHYTGPHTQKGSLVANSPLDLLCIDLLKVDQSKEGKENVLVLTDALPKFRQAFFSNNQKALTITKILVNKWFYVYGIPIHINSDKGQRFENDIISHLYTMCNIKQSMTTPYNPCWSSICERFNCALLDLTNTLPKEQKANWPLHIQSFVLAYNMMLYGITSYQAY